MLVHVPIGQIDDNPFQKRQDYGDVESLAADIQQRGLLQVPRGRLVYAHGETIPAEVAAGACYRIQTDGFPAGLRVQLAFGHRRLRAYKRLADCDHPEFDEMPIYIEALTDDQMLDAVWSENQHRSDINAIEQAELLAAKLERARADGGNQTTVAAEWRLDRSTVANKLRLLDLPAEVQTAVRERRLSERQALALLPVVEMANKLNGTTVEWSKGTTQELYSRPIAPAAFMRFVVDNPDVATSDRIRDYARRAADHAGAMLPDHLAVFDAGQGEGIVQSICNGCRYRHNQYCLNRPCFSSKYTRFAEGIAELAMVETGLIFNSDPNYVPKGEVRDLRLMYDNGVRGGLEVSWVHEGYSARWARGRAAGYRREDEIVADWKLGLVLRPAVREQASDAAEDAGQDAVEMSAALIEWRQSRRDALDARRARVIAALVAVCAPLGNHPATRTFLALLDAAWPGYGARLDLDAPFEETLANFVTIHMRYAPAEKVNALIERAGLDPAVADLTDEADRLRETAVESLLAWYDYDHSPSTAGRVSIALGQVLNQFEAAGINEDDDELGDLLPWLRRAYDAAGDVINGREAG